MTAPESSAGEAPHPYPGALVVVEGIDGSGKSTQLHLLRRHLEGDGYAFVFTEWNSSTLVRDTMKKGKKKNLLTPTTFSLLHAVDFADRYYYEILPALKAGMVVLADRYVYTAFARDAARGVEPDWVRNLYDFAVKPDLALYFKVSIDVSLARLTGARAKIKYYEAGMDLNLTTDVIESFRLFQGTVLDEYDGIAKRDGLHVIDATRDIESQQTEVREAAEAVLRAKTLRRAPDTPPHEEGSA